MGQFLQRGIVLCFNTYETGGTQQKKIRNRGFGAQKRVCGDKRGFGAGERRQGAHKNIERFSTTPQFLGRSKKRAPLS